MTVRTKRVYDDPAPDDGTRVLVDRLWPRRVSKAEAELDDCSKTAAQSEGLRRWFDHDPDQWSEFRERYRAERADRPDEVGTLLEYTRSGTLTLLYAATDREHDNAVVLAEQLDDGARWTGQSRPSGGEI